MSSSATGVGMPICFLGAILLILTQKSSQKFGDVLGIGNFSREGANSYGSACQTSRNVQKQGWETAGIYRRLTRNLHQRQKGAGLQRGRKPARYTDKRGEGDSSSRS